MGKLTGIIIFYLQDKGYGYLRLAGTQEEFHFRKKHLLTNEVRAGDQVRFDLREGRQGYFAANISLRQIT